MAEVTVAQLAAIGARFNSTAQRAFPSHESAAAGNALFAEAENQEKLGALQAQLEPFGHEQEEQLKIIEENQPAVNVWAELGVEDPSQLSEEQREGIKQMATMLMGVPPDLFDKPFVADTEEVAAAKALAVQSAEAALKDISDRAAPTFLQLQETVAGILKQVLPEETFSEVAEFISARLGLDEGVSAGFAANNAPALASAFAPRPQA